MTLPYVHLSPSPSDYRRIIISFSRFDPFNFRETKTARGKLQKLENSGERSPIGGEIWKLTGLGERDDLGGSRVEIVDLLLRFLSVSFTVDLIGRTEPRVVFSGTVGSLIEISIGILVAAVEKVRGIDGVMVVVRSVGRITRRGLSLCSVECLERQMSRYRGQGSVYVRSRSEAEFR